MAKRYRSRVRVGGKAFRNSHVVWNRENPDDPILPGEVIHHKDENKKNDAPENLEKMSDEEHRSLHAKKHMPLVKWASENPEAAAQRSRKCVRQMHKVLRENPEKELERRAKVSIALIAANKRRRGEKRSQEFKDQHGRTMKRIWEDPEQRDKRSAAQKEMWRKRKEDPNWSSPEAVLKRRRAAEAAAKTRKERRDAKYRKGGSQKKQ